MSSLAAYCTADDLDSELGDKGSGMGSSFRPPQEQQQTERGVANANQRRARALRVGMARGVLLIHDAFVEGLGPAGVSAGELLAQAKHRLASPALRKYICPEVQRTESTVLSVSQVLPAGAVQT